MFPAQAGFAPASLPYINIYIYTYMWFYVYIYIYMYIIINPFLVVWIGGVGFETHPC